MRAYVAKEFTFDAAHQLPNHQGKCARLHGHTYRVIVHLLGDVNGEPQTSTEGMVRDFADVSVAFNSRIKEVCDHRFMIPTLNTSVRVEDREDDRYYEVVVGLHNGKASSYDLPYESVALLPIFNTTAECLSNWMLEELHAVMPEVIEVTVYETPTSSATAAREA